MLRRFATVFLSCVAGLPSAGAQFGFTDLRAAGLLNTNLVGLSADGATIVGAAPDRLVPDLGAPAYYRGGQLIYLPKGDFGNGIARGIAPDGAIVGGLAYGKNVTISGAAVWRNGSLGLLEVAHTGGIADAYAISSDGHVIAGSASLPNFLTQPARWVDGHIEPLGDIPGSNSIGHANAVNADGSVIVGAAAGNNRAFRWMNGAMEALPLINPDSVQSSLAQDVSADGRRIVGAQNPANFFTDALLWEDGVPRSLPKLPGANRAFAEAISDDGNLVFGESGVGFETGIHAFMWDETNGTRDLMQILIDGGANLHGWQQLKYVEDVSADGHTILGYGYDAQGNYSPFLATIPEPGMITLVLIGLAACTARRR